MSFRYHVTLSESQKDIFQVENKEDLPKTVFMTFGINNIPTFSIQMWHPDFEDWSNTSLKSLPNKARLRFVIVEDSSVKLPVHSTTSQEQSTNKEPPMEPQSTHEPTAAKLKEWPLEFKILVDRFPRSLKDGLEAQRPMHGNLLTQLTSCIYEELTQYTFYPTSDQYSEMARALIRKFPYLGEGLATADAISLWKTAIAYKVRNCRKRVDRDIPIVQSQKKKKSDSGTLTAREKALGFKKTQWGVANFSPSRPVEEEDETKASHIDWMKGEAKKTKPNSSKINLLMNKTFADRRRLILEMATAGVIKEAYPCLFTRNQILCEFERLTEWKIEALLSQGLAKYADAILHESAKSPHKAQIISAISDARDEDVWRGIKADGVLMLTPQIMGEKFSTVAIEKSKIVDPPKHAAFTYTGDLLNPNDDCACEVFVDGVSICADLVTVFDAFAIVMAAYYVFNLSYPKELCKTLTFIQKVFLNIQDCSKPPAQVLKVLKRVNVYLAK